MLKIFYLWRNTIKFCQIRHVWTYTFCPKGDLKIRSQELKMTAASSTMSQQIRSIIDDYSATLNKATKEIKALTQAKGSLEKAYEDLMVVNENLIQDLVSLFSLFLSLSLSLFLCFSVSLSNSLSLPISLSLYISLSLSIYIYIFRDPV